MTVEEAIALVEQLLERGSLTKAQQLVFRYTWEGKTYLEMAKQATYDPGHIKDVGSQLWRSLSQALGEKVTKNNLHGVLRRAAQQHNRVKISSSLTPHIDWGEATDVSRFYGRTSELETLSQWIVGDRCRLITLLGMGGIGKTTLAVKVAEDNQHAFEYIFWRSLRNAPPIQNILSDLIKFLSHQQETNLLNNNEALLALLMKYLSLSRCLIILDNVETVFISGIVTGNYREGYESYGQLFRYIAELSHQSCLLLTSREKPKCLGLKEGEHLPIRSLKVTGLSNLDIHKIFQDKGFSASLEQEKLLTARYSGNPLALRIVANTIQELFSGNILQFLEYDNSVFGDIWELLEQQCKRLSPLEKQVMCWLAINREAVSIAELKEDIVPYISTRELIQSLESLRGRSLIETSYHVANHSVTFTQQPVVMEYVIEKLGTAVFDEITINVISILNSYPLIKATAKDYIRKSQIYLFLKPLVDKLLIYFLNENTLEDYLYQIIKNLQNSSQIQPGYVAIRFS